MTSSNLSATSSVMTTDGDIKLNVCEEIMYLRAHNAYLGLVVSSRVLATDRDAYLYKHTQ